MSITRDVDSEPILPELITILIIDDQEDAHQLIKLSLKHIEPRGMKIRLLQAYNRRKAEQLVQQEPDIHLALLDARMPGGPGSDGRWLIPALIERRILVIPFTVFDDAASAMQELLGVPPLAKWADPEEIGQNLTVAVARRFSAGFTQQPGPWLTFLAQEGSVAPDGSLDAPTPGALDLSPSEIAILLCEGEDKTLEVIAQELRLSPSTVYGHRSRLMRKLGVTTNPALRRWARQYFRELEQLARKRGGG
jgi:DNA-binding NarL/FixJ family response regulator